MERIAILKRAGDLVMILPETPESLTFKLISERLGFGWLQLDDNLRDAILRWRPGPLHRIAWSWRQISSHS